MTYRVTISAQAEADLRGIYEYIVFKLRSTINAAGQLERLEKAINGLDTMPERYPLYGAGKWAERGLRKMPVDNYLVYYIPDKDALTVTVIRVLYGGTDVKRKLESETQSQ